MQQAITLFGNEEDYYEALLLSWLRREYSRSWKNVVRYNDIRNAGPNVLRKGKLLDRVIDRLEKEEVIDIDYSTYGARKVYKGRHFDNNPFTKHAAYQHYWAPVIAISRNYRREEPVENDKNGQKLISEWNH